MWVSWWARATEEKTECFFSSFRVVDGVKGALGTAYMTGDICLVLEFFETIDESKGLRFSVTPLPFQFVCFSGLKRVTFCS